MRAKVLILLWLVIGALSLWTLETDRTGLTITHDSVGQTPVMRFAQPGATGPKVVIAHGFAGSSQMMQGYAQALARAGYRVTAFDFEGHGRNAVPMSGDVTSVDGTTRRLVDQTRKVMASLPGEAPIALLGHSMATDVLVRVAEEEPRSGPLVLISAFSQEITARHPRDLLLIPGAWETRLRAFAQEAVTMVQAEVGEQSLATSEGLRRMSAPAPYAEHVSVLHSRAGRVAAVAWLNAAYGHNGPASAGWTGQSILALMFAMVALTAPLARCLTPTHTPPAPLPAKQGALIVGIATLAAPLLAVLIYRPVLPVLVADYLALHLLVYGAVVLLGLARLGRAPHALSLAGLALLLVWGLAAFGFVLDRYAANFWPTPNRLWLIALLALGTLPSMIADATLADGAPLWQRLTARLGFVISLGIAVALKPSDLFFVLMIAPVIVLFYLVHGIMGRYVARRCGPLTAGLALGLILAWALGVSFPLFETGGMG